MRASAGVPAAMPMERPPAKTVALRRQDRTRVSLFIVGALRSRRMLRAPPVALAGVTARYGVRRCLILSMPALAQTVNQPGRTTDADRADRLLTELDEDAPFRIRFIAILTRGVLSAKKGRRLRNAAHGASSGQEHHSAGGVGTRRKATHTEKRHGQKGGAQDRAMG